MTERAYFVGRVTVEGSPDPPEPRRPRDGHETSTRDAVRRYRYPSGDGQHHGAASLQWALPRDGDHLLGREPEHDQVDIDFTIDPGNRAKFGGIALEGNPLRSPAAVIRSTRWRRFWGFGPWKPFTEQRLQAGVDGLRSYYQKNNHLLARVSLTRLEYDEPANRVTPLLRIDPGPLVRVRVEGAKVSKGKMRSLLPMYQEHSVDQSLLVEGRRNLIEYFQSQGYFDVEADFEQFPEDNGVQVIEYIVDRARPPQAGEAGNRRQQILRRPDSEGTNATSSPPASSVSATAAIASATCPETSTPSNSSTARTDSGKRRSRRRSRTTMRVRRAISELSCMSMRDRSGLYPRWNSRGRARRTAAIFWE